MPIDEYGNEFSYTTPGQDPRSAGMVLPPGMAPGVAGPSNPNDSRSVVQQMLRDMALNRPTRRVDNVLAQTQLANQQVLGAFGGFGNPRKTAAIDARRRAANVNAPGIPQFMRDKMDAARRRRLAVEMGAGSPQFTAGNVPVRLNELGPSHGATRPDTAVPLPSGEAPTTQPPTQETPTTTDPVLDAAAQIGEEAGDNPLVVTQKPSEVTPASVPSPESAAAPAPAPTPDLVPTNDEPPREYGLRSERVSANNQRVLKEWLDNASLADATRFSTDPNYHEQILDEIGYEPYNAPYDIRERPILEGQYDYTTPSRRGDQLTGATVSNTVADANDRYERGLRETIERGRTSNNPIDQLRGIEAQRTLALRDKQYIESQIRNQSVVSPGPLSGLSILGSHVGEHLGIPGMSGMITPETGYGRERALDAVNRQLMFLDRRKGLIEDRFGPGANMDLQSRDDAMAERAAMTEPTREDRIASDVTGMRRVVEESGASAMDRRFGVPSYYNDMTGGTIDPRMVSRDTSLDPTSLGDPNYIPDHGITVGMERAGDEIGKFNFFRGLAEGQRQAEQNAQDFQRLVEDSIIAYPIANEVADDAYDQMLGSLYENVIVQNPFPVPTFEGYGTPLYNRLPGAAWQGMDLTRIPADFPYPASLQPPRALFMTAPQSSGVEIPIVGGQAGGFVDLPGSPFPPLGTSSVPTPVLPAPNPLNEVQTFQMTPEVPVIRAPY